VNAECLLSCSCLVIRRQVQETLRSEASHAISSLQFPLNLQRFLGQVLAQKSSHNPTTDLKSEKYHTPTRVEVYYANLTQTQLSPHTPHSTHTNTHEHTTHTQQGNCATNLLQRHVLQRSLARPQHELLIVGFHFFAQLIDSPIALPLISVELIPKDQVFSFEL